MGQDNIESIFKYQRENLLHDKKNYANNTSKEESYNMLLILSFL